jgi:GNAT superfamily N-acetyltransferase
VSESEHTNGAAGTDGSRAERLRFGEHWAAMHRLGDGTKTRLRLLCVEDRDLLLRGFEKLSSESRYRRFFSTMPRLPENILRRLLRVDEWNHVAVAAEAATHGSGAEEPFGVARFIRLSEMPATAEATVAVVDHMQGRGLGKLLLSALAAAARERGIKKFRAEVLRSNEAVKALLREHDESLQPVSADGVTAVYEVCLRDIPEFRPLSIERVALLDSAPSGT